MKNLKVSSLMVLGFGSVILLLLIISTASYMGLGTAIQGFTDYRNLAHVTNLAGRLQSNMLMVRMNVKDFNISGSPKSVEAYEQYKKAMTQFLADAKKVIIHPERADKIAQVDKKIRDYEQGFGKIVQLRKELDALVASGMNPNDVKMRENLATILRIAFSERDSTSVHYAGQVQEHVLLGLLHASRFLNQNVEADAKRVKKEFQEEINSLIATLDTELEYSEELHAAFEVFVAARDAHCKVFEKVVQNINLRNSIQHGTLDRLGLEVGKDIEDINLSILADQEALGPRVQQNNEQTVAVVLGVALVSLFLTFFLAWWITRLVCDPLGGQPLMLAGLLQKLAQGDLNIRLPANCGKPTSLASSMARMVDKLREVVESIVTASDNVAAGSAELSDAAQNLSQGTTQQAASIEETSAAMEQMTSNIEQNVGKGVHLPRKRFRSVDLVALSLMCISVRASCMYLPNVYEVYACTRLFSRISAWVPQGRMR